MKKVNVLLLLTFCIFFVKLDAQLKPMQNGLPAAAQCSCFDSIGNLYALTGQFSDTVRVHRWDVSTNTWTEYARKRGSFSPYGANKTSCNFLYGDLIISGIRQSLQDHSYIYRYRNSNSSWTELARVSHGWYQSYWGDFTSYKLNNKIYYAGHMDSFNGSINPGVLAFDGTSFSTTNSPSMTLFGPVFTSKNDTLLLTAYNHIWAYHSSTWFKYYSTNVNDRINGVASQNNHLIISEGNKIKKWAYGNLIDSMVSPFSRPIPTAIGDKIFLSFKNYGSHFLKQKQSVYTLDNNFKLSFVLRNQVLDSGALTFAYNGTKLFIHGDYGIIHNANNYNFIAEVEIDSLKEVPIDTLIVKVYRDMNKNDLFDNGDVSIGSEIKELNSELHYDTDNAGIFRFYPLDNEDCRFEFTQELNNPDSCFKSPFSGARSGLTYNSPSTRDTIFLPIWRTSLQNRNIKNNSYTASTVARMSNPTSLFFGAKNVDCEDRSATITITVDLDPNTVYLSSNPNYTNKSGNRLTFTVTPSANQTGTVTMVVDYPDSLYTLNQLVKHYSKISTTFTEDSSDNFDSVVQRMVYSYDPNVKSSWPQGKVVNEVKKIRYTIEFQNEGNDDAWMVRVVDTLDLSLPLTGFNMLGTSHPYTVSNKGNIVTWVFDKIYLKPKSVNEEASKGFIVFEAQMYRALKVGDSIRNKAAIFFDYNEPIITNYAVLTRIDKDTNGSSVAYIQKGLKPIHIYPNPGNGLFTVENPSDTKDFYHIYDLRGVMVKSFAIDSVSSKVIDLSEFHSGVYFMKSLSGNHVTFVIE